VPRASAPAPHCSKEASWSYGLTVQSKSLDSIRYHKDNNVRIPHPSHLPLHTNLINFKLRAHGIGLRQRPGFRGAEYCVGAGEGLVWAFGRLGGLRRSWCGRKCRSIGSSRVIPVAVPGPQPLRERFPADRYHISGYSDPVCSVPSPIQSSR
jgi:hypothetical protein